MTGPMLGIDYSAQATALAKGIAAKRDKSDIEFETVDFLSEDLPAWHGGAVAQTATVDGHHDLPAFDVILDKGTLDAILLATKDSEVGPLHVRYPHRMARMLRSGGTFLITSCRCSPLAGIDTLALMTPLPSLQAISLVRSCWTCSRVSADTMAHTLLELTLASSDLELVDEIKRPSFQFGGSVGQTITTLAFRAATR